MVLSIATKFGTVTHINPLACADRQNVEILKIHDCGGRHSDQKIENSPV